MEDGTRNAFSVNADFGLHYEHLHVQCFLLQSANGCSDFSCCDMIL